MPQNVLRKFLRSFHNILLMLREMLLSFYRSRQSLWRSADGEIMKLLLFKIPGTVRNVTSTLWIYDAEKIT